MTDEQKQGIYSVQAEYRGQIEELRQKIRELEKKEKGAMEKVLTQAQKDRLQELVKEKVGIKPEANKDK